MALKRGFARRYALGLPAGRITENKLLDVFSGGANLSLEWREHLLHHRLDLRPLRISMSVRAQGTESRLTAAGLEDLQ
jgi:hypothetical protein